MRGIVLEWGSNSCISCLWKVRWSVFFPRVLSLLSQRSISGGKISMEHIHDSYVSVCTSPLRSRGPPGNDLSLVEHSNLWDCLSIRNTWFVKNPQRQAEKVNIVIPLVRMKSFLSTNSLRIFFSFVDEAGVIDQFDATWIFENVFATDSFCENQALHVTLHGEGRCSWVAQCLRLDKPRKMERASENLNPQNQRTDRLMLEPHFEF